MKPILFSVLVAILCLPFLSAQDGTKADIRGVIKTVSPAKANAAGIVGSIMVDGKKEPTTNVDKALVRIGPKTKIERLDGKDTKPAAFADLKAGERVQVDFSGPVAQSYPVQALAARILILGK